MFNEQDYTDREYMSTLEKYRGEVWAVRGLPDGWERSLPMTATLKSPMTEVAEHRERSSLRPFKHLAASRKMRIPLLLFPVRHSDPDAFAPRESVLPCSHRSSSSGELFGRQGQSKPWSVRVKKQSFSSTCTLRAGGARLLTRA